MLLRASSVVVLLLSSFAVRAGAQSPVTAKTPSTADTLIGGYGPYRANNALLFYKLSIRVDPEAQTIAGTNNMRFKMLADGARIQLELAPELGIDSIKHGATTLHYEREERTVWVDFMQTLHKGQTYEISFAYSGKPMRQGRFGCFSFDKDTQGKPWITTACEEEGASVWWPNKDQWRDEPQDGMEINVAVPNGLMDISNGRFEGSKDLGDGYTEWKWLVHYPINNYDVALNIGAYQHFGGKHGETTLDYYALPDDMERAKVQFAQVPQMLDAFEHYFGEYPFDKDGYKLIEVPYAGMEHQSAVAYGNHFENGYDSRAPRGNDPEDMAKRDWTRVGISPKFDFIIIHETGHEWFGNAVTAADKSDMWIHEGWTTYMESLYVEYRWGKADAIRYINGRKSLVDNNSPIITPHGATQEPPRDQYDKAALMINTLRSVIDDDAKWFADIHDFYQHFKYQQIMTEDVVAWWNARTGLNLTPFFDEYLRHAAIPTLVLRYDPKAQAMMCSWKADEKGFDMPIKVGDPAHWVLVRPAVGKDTTMHWQRPPEDFKVATDLYYVQVERVTAQ